MITKQAYLLEHKRRLELEVVSPAVSARLMSMVVQLTLMDMILERHSKDPHLMRIREQIQGDQTGDFLVDASGVLGYKDRACVPMDTEIIE